jgi:SAM-dependent methyltransferase
MARRALRLSWTEKFFRPEIFTPGSAEAESAAPAEARFVWKALGLKRGARVLDVACGTGRHAVRLARRGANVVGVDATPAYLREARRAARGIANARFTRGDMRVLAYVDEFDAAVNLWTSFGYFETPAEDLEVVRGIARALKPGGKFLIDLIDYGAVSRRRRFKNWSECADGSYLLEEAVFLGGWDPRIATYWVVLRRGEPARTAHSVVRGYDRKRLFALLRRAGLHPTRTWSEMTDYGSRTERGTRLVVLAVKGSGLGGAAVK